MLWNSLFLISSHVNMAWYLAKMDFLLTDRKVELQSSISQTLAYVVGRKLKRQEGPRISKVLKDEERIQKC